MPLLNFKPQFVPLIECGSKTHTIRAKRKHPAKVGDKLYLYTGLRQKGARKIMNAICTKVEAIKINVHGVIHVDEIALFKDEAVALALRDGFNSHAEMLRFWEGRLPFAGDIIHWRAA